LRQADDESPGSVAERASVALVLGGHAAHPAGEA
jgi:ATP-binding cassette subfamily B protein